MTNKKLKSVEVSAKNEEEFDKRLRTISIPKLQKKLNHNTSKTIGMSFGDVWLKYKEQIQLEYNWRESTVEKYNNTICNQLAPIFGSKPMADLTNNDYEMAIKILREKYGSEYSQSRIDQFRGNLWSIAQFAYACGITPSNPIENFKSSDPKSLTKELVRERLSERSLSFKNLSNIVARITIDVENEVDEALSLAFMLYEGIRNNEVLAVFFGDIHPLPYDKGNSVWITKGNYNGQVTENVKTSNAYRIIPIHPMLQALIDIKKKQLLGKGLTEEQICKLPVAFKHKNYNEICTTEMLSLYGKSVLLDSGVKHNILIFPPDFTDEIKDKENDPTAYSLRRNFATYAKSICGLTCEELKYIMGHTQDESEHLKLHRKYNTNDLQILIKEKLERWKIPTHVNSDIGENSDLSADTPVPVSDKSYTEDLSQPAELDATYENLSPNETDNPILISNLGDSEIDSSNEDACNQTHQNLDKSNAEESQDVSENSTAAEPTHKKCLILFTCSGRIRGTPIGEYPISSKSCKGVKGPDYKNDHIKFAMCWDIFNPFFFAITDKGNLYKLPAASIPEVSRTILAKRETLNVFPFRDDEKIICVIPSTEPSNSNNLITVTSQGKAQRVSAEFMNSLALINDGAAGMQIMSITNEDKIVSAFITTGNQNIFLASSKGKGICFNENDIAKTNSIKTKGVIAMQVGTNDCCVKAAIASEDRFILSISANGYGKCSSIRDYWSGPEGIQKKGGIGKSIQVLDAKTDELATFAMITRNAQEEIALVCTNGQVRRFRTQEIPVDNRKSNGDRLIDLDSAKVSDIAVI